METKILISNNMSKSPNYTIVKPWPQTPWAQWLTLMEATHPTSVNKKFQVYSKRKDMGVVQHLQQEHHQSYLLHYQYASIQGRQIQCRKDSVQNSNKDRIISW